MLPLLLGMLLFVGIHLMCTQVDLRQGLVRRFGEMAYKGFFSVVALAGLVLIVIGYHKAQIMPGKNPQLWSPPTWGRHATMALMLPVFSLLLAAYLPMGRIKAVIGHPMITAVMLWAVAHLLVRGDAASLLLFGGLLGWAVADRISLKRRDQAAGVKRAGGSVVYDVIAVVGGLLLYGAMLKWGHAALIGIRLSP